MTRPWRIYILLAVFFAIFVIIGLIGHLRGGFDPVRDHSSLRTNPWGTKAYRELLQRCEVRTESWNRPLTELSSKVKLLLILDPRRAISDDEQEHLLDWVRAGGRLVFAPFGEGMYRPACACGPGGCVEGGATARHLLTPLGLVLSATGEPDERAKVAQRSAVTGDVRSVHVPSEHRLAQSEDAETVREMLREQGLDEDWIARWDVPQGAQVRTDLLAEGRPVMMTLQLGQGRVHVLAEVELLANAEIAKADNVVLAANLVFAGGAPAQVHFDEYHHFMGRAFAAGREEVDVRPVHWTLWAILAVAAIYAVGRAQRFGAPEVGGDQVPRSSADYIKAFAEIYSRARAGGAAMKMLAAAFRRKLAHTTGLPVSADAQRLAGALHRRGLPGAEMVDLLTSIERQAQEKTSEAELVRLAEAIAKYERML